jgi:hypothetical protein
MIKTSTSSIYEESKATCDGSITAIQNALTCTVPLTTLIASPFTLAQGSLVKVKIIAVNAVGSSAGSFDNTSGALVELVPHKPPTSPIKNASTT